MKEPKKAHHTYLSLCTCGCGSMTIELCDENDVVFAEAIYDAQSSIDLAGDILRMQDENMGEAIGCA